MKASHQHGRLKECNQRTRINVTFTPTIPIWIDKEAPEKYLSLRILVPQRSIKQTTSTVDKCVLKLDHGMLPSDAKPLNISITPACDNIDQTAIGSMEYRFVIPGQNSLKFWFSHKLPSVRVMIIKYIYQNVTQF